MAVMRRRKLVLVFSFGFIAFSVVILTTYYTTQQHRILVIGDGPLLVNEADFGDSLRGGENANVDLFDRFVNADFIENDEISLRSVEAKMAARTKQVRTVCTKMKEKNLSPPNQPLYQHEDLKHLIYNKDHQVLYCYLPKVANTNFRRVFLGLQGIVPKPEVPSISGYEIYFKYDKTFKHLNSLKPLEQSQLLRQYKKFLVVRNPLERLLSGYRNKFFHPNERHKAEYHDKVTAFYGLHPHLRRRNNVRVDFNSKEMTFEEFLLYFTDVYEVNEYLNEHFVPSNQLCNPCNVKYDYIGKYESLNNDVKYIFERLNIDIDFPGRNDNYSSVSTSTLVEEFYKPIPDWLLQKTWEIMKFDFLVFGYHLPEWYREKLKKG
ncbi:carbohydrate sulfotransferase 11-like [Mercenaria mercenaria]|uniref:carbohydrate sulfotransferase 11-like n=1 Tax=Mercenaria mercenaria TaxID=6596 RepID=UPI00234F032F|nr:carbohydrate sulfotransferase 11-like [Mercenaria mercenaria]